MPGFAAHLFIFYYAVLSEVSPPTALLPFAAAITGGDPYKTTLQSWKNTIPAFLLPFMFVLNPAGQGLLLIGSSQALAATNWWSIAEVTLTAIVGTGALNMGFQGWALKRTTPLERWMLIAAGFALVYPGYTAKMIGFGLMVAALVIQFLWPKLQAAWNKKRKFNKKFSGKLNKEIKEIKEVERNRNIKKLVAAFFDLFHLLNPL